MAAPNVTTEAVTMQTRGRIAIITLNQPKKLNAMSMANYYTLSCLMQKAAADPNTTITVLTGTGRFFSAGADVTSTRPGGDRSIGEDAIRREILGGFLANNIDTTRAFYTHPKILVVALNGPTVGLSAALLGFADFVYAAPHAFLLTPFSSLGLVTEGGASIGLVQRMGISKANEALIMSRRIPCEELVQCGFVNKVFKAEGGDSDSAGFLELVLKEVDERLGEHLNQESLVKIKALIRAPGMEALEAQGVKEALEGVKRFMDGAPQREFQRIASGEKRHKL